jgi:DNA-binding NtrC family response regulator/tetratricopeptide (TPR) repeat protein
LGKFQEGIGLQRKGIALAATCDIDLEAELLADLASGLLNWLGIEPALSELPRLKRLSLAAGNTRTLVDYRILTARIATMRGLLRRGEAESQMAAALLGNAPNSVQSWKVEQVLSNIAIKGCDLESARTHALKCLAMAEASGSKLSIGTTLGNLAHIASMAGDVHEGREYLQRAISALDSSSQMLVAAYSTGIELGLAADDDAFVESMIATRDRSEPIDATEVSYYGLWFELNRSRWLVKTGRYAEAVSTAMATLKTIERRADADLLDQMRLVAAEAHNHLGERAAALDFFRLACSARSNNLETVAELNRIGALLAGHADIEAASQLLHRAQRVLTSTGLLGRTHWVADSAQRLGITLGGSWISSVSAKEAVRSIGASLQLGRHPQALAAETLWLLQAVGRATSGTICLKSGGEQRVVESFQASSTSEKSVDFELSFDVDDKHSYAIRGEYADQPLIFLDRTAIEHIARSAVAADRALTSVEAAVALWPEETPEEQLGMIVASANMLEVVNTARRLAPSTIPVLITGETGTGKELLARALHDASPRKNKPFIPFNCTAVARDMLDAQLFGYRRGAFTGAQDAFPGIIRAAAGGTLFLDEIGEITLDVQPKLLRFLESNEIHPLGEPKPIHVDVRVVAATNANLEQMVSEGRFREDLFYRLNVVRLPVPALRERREEIPLLVQHYLDKFRREAQKAGLRIAEDTMEYLILYAWPGNVRQLANELRRLVALAEAGAVLMPEHLSREIAASRRTIPASERDLAPTEFVVRLDQPMVAAMEHVERAMILHALRQTHNRVEEAARLLGLSRKGLYLKRLRLGIDLLETADAPSTAAEPAEID